jgi:hypothetical protein
MEGILPKIGRDEQKETVKIMKEWLKQQPNLPNEFGKEISINYNNNKNIYYKQFGRHPVAGVTLHITLYMHGL